MLIERIRFVSSIALGMALVGILHAIALGSSQALEGFGTQTAGGQGRPVYHVTNLNDTGPGSLRDAVSQGNRYIVFDVAGTIVPKKGYIDVKGPFITIDGFSAPSRGITLHGFGGLRIRADKGAHDVIVQGLRIRNAGYNADTNSVIDDSWDGIQVAGGAYNIVIDHVSVSGAADGNIDITQPNTRNVTVSWSILAQPGTDEKNMLIDNKASNITLHHNIFTASKQRNPQATFDIKLTQDTKTTLDMRNNIIWNWHGGYGTRIRYGVNANIVDNFYGGSNGDMKDALIVCKGLTQDNRCYSDTKNIAWAFVSGNVTNAPTNSINEQGNQTTPFTAPFVTSKPGCEAASNVLAGAGLRPFDALDIQYIAAISTEGCHS